MIRLKTILQYRYTTLIFLLIIIILAILRINTIDYPINETKTSFVGYLLDKKIDGDKFIFIIKDEDKIRCTYYIKSLEEKEKMEHIKIGVKISLVGTVSIPTNNTIKNTFNYKDYLFANDIYYTVSVDNLKVIDTDLSLMNRIKNWLNTYLDNYKSKAYLNTFITGNKNYLDDNVYSTYQELGVSHIFAISGMHVSILASIIFKLLYKLKDNTKYYIVITFLLIYASITNYAASILRSISLYICLFINKRFNLNLSTIQAYYLAIGILLLIMPKLMLNIGFLYSAITSFSLIKYNYLIKGSYIKKCLIISIIAFLFSLPITVNNNYEINILSIFNNLLFVPLITFIIYPLSLLCLFIPILDNIFYNLMILVESISSHLLVSNVVIPRLPILIIILYYLFLNLFLLSYEKKYLLITIMILTIEKVYPYIDPSYYIYFLDVGQGDSIVIKYKDEAILIDTGGKITYETEEWQKKEPYHISSNTIVFLKSIGVDNIDYMILSHGDYDHMGEATYLINNFKVNKVIFNHGEYNNLELNLIEILEEKDIKYYYNIKELNLDDNKLYFLNNEIYDNENDNSSVIYTNLNGTKMLLMGDAGVEVEEEILKNYNLNDIDILKVGHHGSKTSSSKEFIDEVNPRYSIISVGKNNRYGHPNAEVLDNLVNTQIYRTDRDGSIMFKIKNNKSEIETCTP